MQKSIISLMVVGIAAGAIGYNIRSSNDSGEVARGEKSPTAGTISSPASAQTMADFATLLNQETAARKALAQELDVLKQRVAELQKRNTPGVSSAEASNNTTATEAHAAMGITEGGSDWFNAQAMVDAGVDVTVAEQIKQQYESREMKKLYLRDRAVREGWLRSERYLRELEKLDSGNENIRDQYGDKAYDAYLYAAGLPNRVEVQSVLENSPAAVAGLQAGDKIISYDNQRIYTGQELRDATARGKANDVVTVDIERGDETRQIYLSRGPMGIRMTSISVAP